MNKKIRKEFDFYFKHRRDAEKSLKEKKYDDYFFFRKLMQYRSGRLPERYWRVGNLIQPIY